MDKKLIAAAILSLIGAGIVALIIGLSVYTVAFLPAFIIVLVFNIWGGQRTKAVWLGFLLSLMVIPFPTFLITLDFSHSDGLEYIMLLDRVIVIIAFILVFAVFLRRQETKRIPDRRLAVLAGIFLILAALVLIAEKVWYIKLYYRATEQWGGPGQLNWPSIVLTTSSQAIITICISALLLLKERFTFFVVAPVFLVYNLLVSLNRIFVFTGDHLTRREIIRYLTMPFRTDSDAIFYVFRLCALLSLIIAIYFFRNYKKETENIPGKGGKRGQVSV